MNALKRAQVFQPEFQVLAKVESQKLREDLLKEFSRNPDFCRCVRELVKNAVKLNLPLTKSEKKVLDQHQKVVKGVLSKRRQTSRRFIKQSGGFLPILVPILATLLGEIVAKHVIP